MKIQSVIILDKMSQGNKLSRIVCWTFLSSEEKKKWVSKKW